MAYMNSLPNHPQSGDPRVPGPLVANDEALRQALNEVEADQLDDAEKLGLSGQWTARRGKTIIPTEETMSSASYSFLPTPDKVGVVMPTDGLIFVAFHGTWMESVPSVGKAAIFLGANQLKVVSGYTGLVDPQEAAIGGPTAYRLLTTTPVGLFTHSSGTALGYPGDVTTGQAVAGNVGGGACMIFAAAGYYEVGVKFSASSGSVTAKDRKLWVWTMGF